MPQLSFTYKKRLERTLNRFTITVMEKINEKDKDTYVKCRAISNNLSKKMGKDISPNTQLRLNEQMNRLSDTLDAILISLE